MSNTQTINKDFDKNLINSNLNTGLNLKNPLNSSNNNPNFNLENQNQTESNQAGSDHKDSNQKDLESKILDPVKQAEKLDDAQNKHQKIWKIVIQGGAFSFNEIALNQNMDRVKKAIFEYLKNNQADNFSTHGIENFSDIQVEVIYGYTTAKVFEMLNSGMADFGQFAIHNLTGLLVRESLLQVQQNSFWTLDYYTLKVQHYLMKKRANGQVPDQAPKKIMAHEQVLIQCQKTLDEKLPEYQRIAGSGELTDNSSIAEYIAKTGDGYCLASKYLADIFDLEKVILEGQLEFINLADNKDNYTTFMLIAK